MKEMPERIYLFDCNDAMTTPLEGDTEYIRKDIVDDRIKDFKKSNGGTSMTIEEYDSKTGLRNSIERIEKALHSISRIVEENNKISIALCDSRRICVLDICDVMDDPVITERIKQVLIERKKELVEEFSK